MRTIEKFHVAIFIACLLFLNFATAHAAETDKPVLVDTPHLQKLLREEMRALQEALRTIAQALPQGDWTTVAGTAKTMHDSFIFAQKLTPADKHTLHESLPAGFVQLDQTFHRNATKLQNAASSHDAEMSVYYLSRLVESCVMCHQRYATQRFPTFKRHEEIMLPHH